MPFNKITLSPVTRGTKVYLRRFVRSFNLTKTTMTKEKLREEYQNETGEEIEATQSSIYKIVKIEEHQPDGTITEVEGSWAEWGYVLWLERQILSANAEFSHPKNEGL